MMAAYFLTPIYTSSEKKNKELHLFFKTCRLEEGETEPSKNVRYLYAPSGLDGGQRRATDPIWSMEV